MKKLFSVMFSCLLIISLVTACSSNGSGKKTSGGNSGGVINLKVAHNQSANHPVHKSMQKFLDLALEKTDGKIKGKIFANGQLGSEREVIELVQAGTVDMAKVSAGALESFEEAYTVLSVPYLFNDTKHLFKVMESDIANDLFQSTKDSGFIGITWYDAGERNFYTRKDKPIMSPNDLKGLKIRVQPSDSLIKNVEAMGGNATPMPFGEVYTAMQSGVIDGAENNATAMTDMKLGEVTKHFSFNQHMFTPDILIINAAKFDKLTSEQKKALAEAAKESTQYHKEIWAETTKKSIEEAKKMGVTFHYPDKAPFKESVNSILEEYEKNPKTAEYFKRIKDMEESN